MIGELRNALAVVRAHPACLPPLALNVTDVVPARAWTLVDDLDERVRAMTLHHVAFDLLPLAEFAPCLWYNETTDTAHVHPDTWQLVRAEIEGARTLGATHCGEVETIPHEQSH